MAVASREGAFKATGREATAMKVATAVSCLNDYCGSMKKYSKKFKEKIIARMLPPGNAYIPDLSNATGIPRDTLYSWRIKYRNSVDNPETKNGASENLSSEDKFSIVIETAGLNEVELSQYCRSKGLYPQQIAAWRTSCSQAKAGGNDQQNGEQAFKDNDAQLIFSKMVICSDHRQASALLIQNQQ